MLDFHINGADSTEPRTFCCAQCDDAEVQGEVEFYRDGQREFHHYDDGSKHGTWHLGEWEDIPPPDEDLWRDG